MTGLKKTSQNTHVKEKGSSVMPWMRALKIILLAIVIITVGGVAFVKFDTPAAAIFTDKYLRPVLGSNRVIILEKLFFNASDKFKQQTSKFEQQTSPIIDQGASNNKKNVKIQKAGLDLTPISLKYFTSLQNEGVWINKPLNVFPDKEVMAYTFIRPDADRSYADVTLIQIDTEFIGISAVAGKVEPGGAIGNRGSGVIPKDVVESNNLVAAFDGGFQYKDGAYGMIVGDKTYLPLKNDLGTFVGYSDGSLKIVNYTGQDLGKNIAFIRQNCPILIENGDITPLNPKIKSLWGRTLTSSIYTWRSGVGLTKTGNLIYAVGNNLTPITLGIALKAAGALNAIQLDINPYWVRFNFFNSTGGGKYESSTLTHGLADGSKQYLNGYEKDFFYLYKK